MNGQPVTGPGRSLDDVAWGDVVSDDDGVLVVRGEVDGAPVVVKRYARADHRREIRNHELLAALGVPGPRVLGHGDDWLVMADLEDAGYRLATDADVRSPAVGRMLAHWYAELHTRGAGHTAGLYCEHELVTAGALAAVGVRWTDLAPAVDHWVAALPRLRAEVAKLPETLTHNDFWFTNLAIDDFAQQAVVFDLNLLGRGYRFSDIRNVRAGLSPEAGDAFEDEYQRLCGPIEPRERELDGVLSHLATLVLADLRGLDALPHWARPSRDWLLSGAAADA